MRAGSRGANRATVEALQQDHPQREQVGAAVDGGVAELGRLDIVVANAGITALSPDLTGSAFLDTVNVNFGGVLNVITAAYPHLRAGASIIAARPICGSRGQAAPATRCPSGK